MFCKGRDSKPSVKKTCRWHVFSEERCRNNDGDTRPDIRKWKVEGVKKTAYTGRKITFGNIKVSHGGEYATFKTAYSNNINAGKAIVTITGTGRYSGKIVKSFIISKAANPVKATVKKSITVKSGKKTKIKKAVNVQKAKGRVSFATNNKKVTVKNGSLTAAKGIKKGNYSVKIRITVKGNSNYRAKTITRTVKLRVR